MNKYEIIFEAVQESLNNGEITLEEAEILNDYAYDKYVEEATRLAKEIHKLNSDDGRKKFYTYRRMVDQVPGNLEKNRKDDESGYGDLGYVFTDSLKYGKEQEKCIAGTKNKFGKSSAVYDLDKSIAKQIGAGYKNKQREVFKTEPVDTTTYYNSKKRINDDMKQRALDKNLKSNKKKMHEVNSNGKTYNPIKAYQNQKKREDIAKRYLSKEKDINKGKYKLDEETKEKLKEIIKNRK